MNTIYYLVGNILKDTPFALTGGHGYTYDSDVVGKKKVQKNVPTAYGYFVNADHQSASVNIVTYLNGRVFGKKSIHECFLLHLELVLLGHIGKDGKKILFITNMPKITKAFIDGKGFKEVDGELFKRVHELYSSIKNDVIFDFTLYPKGGSGCRYAHNQYRIGEMLLNIQPEGECKLDVLTEKEFSDPEVEFNELVTASRWYFNTGSTSTFYKPTRNGRRAYHFGKVEPDKNYYGKATPDVYYSTLYTKEPLKLLDRLYDFCKMAKGNDLNRLLAGNISNIKSKEVVRVINDIPGEFKGNQLVSPMKIGTNDEPGLVDYIDPPGLSYRISDALDGLDETYDTFLRRDEDLPLKKMKFQDITGLFFDFTGKKPKIHDEFAQTTIKFFVNVDSPDCVKPVKIALSVRYDCPDRTSYNSLLKNKVEDIKVFLALDFSDPAGVRYCTITSTPDFDLVHSNSISNLRVYNLKELGRNPA